MGPLVYYCRWQGARLRLRGRDGPLVWGELAYDDDAGHAEPFRFNTKTWELMVERGGEWARLQLDEMGVVVSQPAG